mmetsp:Transcript_7967/g.15387  ORF Transcript_7967/g.15387 Transcript_7967/m.15387 type:complete len:225 (+) Transcript_7967:2723-3397(+)
MGLLRLIERLPGPLRLLLKKLLSDRQLGHQALRSLLLSYFRCFQLGGVFGPLILQVFLRGFEKGGVARALLFDHLLNLLLVSRSTGFKSGPKLADFRIELFLHCSSFFFVLGLDRCNLFLVFGDDLSRLVRFLLLEDLDLRLQLFRFLLCLLLSLSELLGMFLLDVLERLLSVFVRLLGRLNLLQAALLLGFQSGFVGLLKHGKRLCMLHLELFRQLPFVLKLS